MIISLKYVPLTKENVSIGLKKSKLLDFYRLCIKYKERQEFGRCCDWTSVVPNFILMSVVRHVIRYISTYNR